MDLNDYLKYAKDKAEEYAYKVNFGDFNGDLEIKIAYYNGFIKGWNTKE